MRLAPAVVSDTASRQAGVATVAQLVELGADTSWLSRQVRSGRWQRLHRGVLVTHSGPITWRSRAWGALLYAGRDAALSHATAAHLQGFINDAPRIIDVSIPAHRRVTPTRGVVVHRRPVMPPTVGRPPRVWPEDTVLDLLRAAGSDDDAVAAVCDAVRWGVPTLALRAAVDRRGGPRRWRLLDELVGEVDAGVESPLERRYRRDVERAHRLPTAVLQRREVLGDLWIRADCVYDGLGLRVELDGALAHPGGRTDLDTWRDNAVLLRHADRTLRYRWRHVALTPCATTAQVLAGLRLSGPHLTATPCSPACPVR